MSEESAALENFGGVVRLFPLPNLVMFPQVVQPLHIFEPRYRQLMADALDGDRLIAMALLCPGWEDDSDRTPPVEPVVCVGRIHQEERLPDGRWNLLLHGVCRAWICEEVATDRLYRTARVELLSDVPVPQEGQEGALRRDLGQRAEALFADAQTRRQVRELVRGPLSLGGLCDVFAFALPLDLEVKQQLLALTSVEARARLLLERIAAPKQGPRRPFPPEFSAN